MEQFKFSRHFLVYSKSTAILILLGSVDCSKLYICLLLQSVIITFYK